jgi:hydroxyacylglutathione hydrolase
LTKQNEINMKLKITPIAAFQDNYIWVIHNDEHAVVVDPGTAAPVNDFLAAEQLNLSQILITHHHWDHVNGLEALQAEWKCPVYAPLDSRIPGDLTIVQEQQLVKLPELGLTFHVIETPGHTLSHICYFNQDWLFCGDTLFSVGCGRMFEGTAEQYVKSLNKIKALPPETAVYCTHEYTLSNLEFALSIEPNNQELKAKKQHVQLLRQQHLPSLPVKLSQEMSMNPFLKANQLEMQTLTQQRFSCEINDEVTCFAMLRKGKDKF